MKNIDKFKVRVINSQTADGETDDVCENGYGTLREKNGVFYIVYKTDTATVMIKTDGSFVNLKRSGDVASEMMYEKGKSTSFVYNTPYGAIDMEIFTRSIVCRLSQDGGMLRIEYVLQTGGDKLYNDIIIRLERGRLA